MYLNAYVPSLQTGGGFVYFLKTQLGVRIPSTVVVAPMSRRFVEAMERPTSLARRTSEPRLPDRRDHLDAVTQPVVVQQQRAAGLRFGDRRVHALMQTLCLFALNPTGFRHRDVRASTAQLLGREPHEYSASQMTYDLRRLRLHGLIERVPRRHRYRITTLGAQIAMLYVRCQSPHPHHRHPSSARSCLTWAPSSRGQCPVL
jgi:hypothetical protein